MQEPAVHYGVRVAGLNVQRAFEILQRLLEKTEFLESKRAVVERVGAFGAQSERFVISQKCSIVTVEFGERGAAIEMRVRTAGFYGERSLVADQGFLGPFRFHQCGGAIHQRIR